MAGESKYDQCAKECSGCSTCSSEPYNTSIAFPSEKDVNDMSRQIFEIASQVSAAKEKIILQNLNMDTLANLKKSVDDEIAERIRTVPVGKSEPVAKTKVWRWEKVMEMTEGTDYLDQTDSLYTEQQAIVNFPGYTKVPGSEREI